MTHPGPHRARMIAPQRSMLAFAMLAMLTVVAAPADGTGPFDATGEPISLRLDGAELADVLRSFSSISHLSIAVVPEVNRYDLLDQSVTVSYESTPWNQVLDEILADAGLASTHEGSVLWIHPPSAALEGDRNFTGDPISLNLEGADVRKVIQVFAAQTGHIFDLDPAVEGKVSVNLEDLPWDQALDLILRITGLSYSRNNGGFEIYPVTDARGMQLLPVRTKSAEGRFEGGRVHRYTKNGRVSEPEKISGPPPEYTDEARADGITGRVVVKVLIDTEGRIAYVEPVMELSHGLTEKAIEAVEQWVFKPATLDGEPVPVEYVVSVVFDLE